MIVSVDAGKEEKEPTKGGHSKAGARPLHPTAQVLNCPPYRNTNGRTTGAGPRSAPTYRLAEVHLLKYFIARRIGPAKPLELGGGGGIELPLQGAIEGARTDEAAVHRGEHLDISNRIEPKTLRNPFFGDPQDFVRDLFWGGGLREREVTCGDGVY